MLEFAKNCVPFGLGLIVGILAVRGMQSVAPEFVNSDWFGMLLLLPICMIYLLSLNLPWNPLSMIWGGSVGALVSWLAFSTLLKDVELPWIKLLGTPETGVGATILASIVGLIKLAEHFYHRSFTRDLAARELAIKEVEAKNRWRLWKMTDLRLKTAI